MRRLWSLLAVSLFCGVVGHGTAVAQQPNKIKVGQKLRIP